MHIRNVILPNYCHAHSHDFHQIIFHTKGEAQFDISGICETMDQTRACIIPTTESHCYKGLGDSRQVIIDLPLLAYQTRVDSLFERPCYFAADSNLLQLVRCLQQEAPFLAHFPEANVHTSMSIMASLYHRIIGEKPQTKFSKRLNIEQIERFIDAHIGEKISVSQLAEMNYVSSGHFNELFAQQTGMPPYQFVLQKRLRKAQELITTTNKPLAYISDEVGFSSQSALTHAFRRHFGYPPKQLRQS